MTDFVLFFRTTLEARKAAMGTPEAAQQLMQFWLNWMRDLETKGHLVSPGQPLENEGKVVRGKKRSVTDGPFIEVKDLIAGFTIIRAKSMAQAQEIAATCPILEGDGSVEIRPVQKTS